MLVLTQLNCELPGDNRSSRFAQRAWAVLAAVLIFDSCLFSNETYLKKELEGAATLSTFTRIIDRMEKTEGFVPGETEIAFVGRLFYSPLSIQKAGFDYTATGLWNSYSTTSYETYPVYLTYYLGYPARCVDSSEIEAYEQLEEVAAMHPFPAADSVKMVDGVLVVKLSDIQEPAEE